MTSEQDSTRLMIEEYQKRINVSKISTNANPSSASTDEILQYESNVNQVRRLRQDTIKDQFKDLTVRYGLYLPFTSGISWTELTDIPVLRFSTQKTSGSVCQLVSTLSGNWEDPVKKWMLVSMDAFESHDWICRKGSWTIVMCDKLSEGALYLILKAISSLMLGNTKHRIDLGVMLSFVRNAYDTILLDSVWFELGGSVNSNISAIGRPSTISYALQNISQLRKKVDKNIDLDPQMVLQRFDESKNGKDLTTSELKDRLTILYTLAIPTPQQALEIMAWDRKLSPKDLLALRKMRETLLANHRESVLKSDYCKSYVELCKSGYLQ